MLLKSMQCSYVGCEDGPKAIKYYSAQSWKVLISRNFCFLNLSNEEIPTQDIIINPHPAIQRERELEDGAPQAESSGSDDKASATGKRQRETTASETTKGPTKRLQKTPQIDYRYLNDPFSDDLGHETLLTSAETIFAVYSKPTLRGNNPKTFWEARSSVEWPYWEKAIQTELTQLKNMGTWKMVEHPKDAKPISNKWVFVRKFDKEGNLLKYKARLIAKECVQRPVLIYSEQITSRYVVNKGK